MAVALSDKSTNNVAQQFGKGKGPGSSCSSPACTYGKAQLPQLPQLETTNPCLPQALPFPLQAVAGKKQENIDI